MAHDPRWRAFLTVTAAAAVAATIGLAGIVDFGRVSAWLRIAKVGAQAIADPAVVGEWSGPVDLPIVAIHMHLLLDRTVLAWGNPSTPPLDGRVQERVWDPTPGPLGPLTFSEAHDPFVDVYCSGHSFLADGRLLATGGHIDRSFIGSPVVSLFDPGSRTWSRGPDMSAGRWYPTNTTLANGDVVVVSGTVTGSQTQDLPEVWNASTGWRALDGARLGLPRVYPWLHLAPNGQVFYSGPGRTTRYLDPRGTGSWTTVGDTKFGDRQIYTATSVMYEPGKVMIMGGCAPNSPTQNREDNGWPLLCGSAPTASAEVIDLTAAAPQWRLISPMAYPRRYLNATLLPDGTVLAMGGSRSANFDDMSAVVLQAELWNPANEFDGDPVTPGWATMAAMSVSRLYHSTALLLPDGRVLVAGGGGDGPGGDGDHYNAEYYSPPYLFRGTRPRISSVPKTVGYGETLTVTSPDALDITQVTLVRLGSVTHHFDQNQRFNRLEISAKSDTGLSVKAPSDPNILPPGHYMLFILNSAGAPSVAEIVRVDAENNDTNPPVITEVTASSLTFSSATITWTTDEASDSQVEYGTTPPPPYEQITSPNSSPVTSHAVSLGELSPDTLYHYRVKSRDAAGNLATSGDFTFRTLPASTSDGLVAYWKFDEGRGSTAADSSGNGNTGTLRNGPRWSTGKVNRALFFDGANDYVHISHRSIQNAYPLTVALWMRTTTTGLTGLVNKYYASSFNGYQVFMNGGQLCAWYFKNSSNYIWDGSGCSLMTPGYADNQWHHVAYIVDASGGRLYVDGVLKTGRAWTGTPGAPSTTQSLSIGRYPGTARPYYRGSLDDVRIYSRALSAAEVSSLYTAP